MNNLKIILNIILYNYYTTMRMVQNGGYKGKATHCFNNGNNLKLYFIEKQDLNVLVDLKKNTQIL